MTRNIRPTALDVSINIFPIKDAEGHPVTAATIARDITERNRMVEALRRNEEQLRLRAAG